MKQYYWLIFLVGIICLDNIANSIILPVSMHLFAIAPDGRDGGYTLNALTYGSGIIFLLSPAYILASPLVGWLSDNIGRKKALIACLAVSLLGYLLLLIANHINSMYLCLFSILLFNAGASSMIVVQASIADISQGKVRAYFLGLIVAVMLPVYLIAAHISENISVLMEHTLLVDNCIVFFALILTILNIFLALKLPTKIEVPEVTFEDDRDFLSSVHRIGQNQQLVLLMLFLFILQFSIGLYNMVFTKNQMHYSLFWEGFDYENLAMLFSIMIIYPILLYRFNIKNILFAAIMVSLLGVFGNFFVETTVLKVVFLCLLEVGQCLSIAVIWLLLLEYSSQKDWGLLMGMKASVWAIAWLFSCMVGYSNFYQLNTLLSFMISFILLLSSSVLIYFTLKQRKVVAI